jgi:hypothetical protein
VESGICGFQERPACTHTHLVQLAEFVQVSSAEHGVVLGAGEAHCSGGSMVHHRNDEGNDETETQAEDSVRNFQRVSIKVNSHTRKHTYTHTP